MKSFSEIRNKLKDYGYLGEVHIPSQDEDKIEESAGVGMQPEPHVDDTEHGNLLNLEDESTFNQLNAFVGSVAHRDYIDPRAAVGNLKNKLSMIGIEFDLDENAIYQGGTFDVPLSRFGVVTGWSKKLDGNFVKGMKTIGEESPYSYMLEMSFEKLMNGLTSVKAQVKRLEKDHDSL
jgi:hypothetical protein